MIITIKNLEHQTFQIQFDPKKTVLQLKQKIYEDQGPDYIVEKQKLIYIGILLEDERTIASYSVDEKRFIVVLLKRDVAGSQKPDTSGCSNTRMLLEKENNTSILPDKTNILSEMDKKFAESASLEEDSKSIGSGESEDSIECMGAASEIDITRIGSDTSIQSFTSGASLLSGSSIDSSSSSETSHSTYSSGDLAGVFSSTSLESDTEYQAIRGEDYQRAVESMIEMGYSREKVERAMNLCLNNPERAVEYLVNSGDDDDDDDAENNSNQEHGNCSSHASHYLKRTLAQTKIPKYQQDCCRDIGGGGDAGTSTSCCVADTQIRQCNQEAAQANYHNHSNLPNENSNHLGEGDANSSSSSMQFDSTGDPFEFLRNQPQFQQMRLLVFQNPQLLHAVLQQIGQTNPALLHLISENQDAFLMMINQPIPGQGPPQYPRRITPGRRAQLVAATRSAAGGDGPHVRPLDTAPGAGGDGEMVRQRPGESGDAGADTIPPDQSTPRRDRVAARRAAEIDAFLRERALAAAAIAELTAAAAAVSINRCANGNNSNDSSSNERNNANNNHNNNSSYTHSLSMDEKDSVDRLMALGFPEDSVLQAYFACDKDEQKAANLLLSSIFNE